MKIKQFELHNIGQFKSLEVALAPTESSLSKVTVFVGNNGAGKTSLLKALATSLSWFVARIRSDKGSGSPISEDVIFNGENSAVITITVEDDSFVSMSEEGALEHRWTIAKSRKGKVGQHSSHLNAVAKLAENYKKMYTENDNCSLSLIAFYPVERVVLDVPLKIKERHQFRQLDGYDNALNQGVDFRRFFEWFREREDSENETGISQEVLDKLADFDSDVWKRLHDIKASSRDLQLTAVRTAISNFMPGFSNLKVRRKPRLHMSIDKNGKTLNVLQLSQGEKSLMALVGDIARRLAMMNPDLQNPLHGDGIVMIDEVDMHLHPTWQRRVIGQLTKTFPNCQFVLTTHSPLVISECKDILVYAIEGGALTEVSSQYGQDANMVLLDVMDTPIRNVEIDKKLNDLWAFIQNRKLDAARILLSELESELPESNFELIKAKMLLHKQELRGEEN